MGQTIQPPPLHTFRALGTKEWFEGPRHGMTAPMGRVTPEDVAGYYMYGRLHRLALYKMSSSTGGGWAWIATLADVGAPPAKAPPHAVRVATTDAEAAAAGRAAALRDGVSEVVYCADAAREAFFASLEMVDSPFVTPASGRYGAFVEAYLQTLAALREGACPA